MSDRSKSLVEALERRRNTSLPDSLQTTSNPSNIFSVPDVNVKLDALVIIPKETNVNLTKALISDLNKKEFSFDNLVVGRHIPLSDSYIILVENFVSAEKTRFYGRFLNQQTDQFNSKGIFKYQVLSISPENLQRLVKSQNLEAYIDWHKTQDN